MFIAGENKNKTCNVLEDFDAASSKVSKSSVHSNSHSDMRRASRLPQTLVHGTTQELGMSTRTHSVELIECARYDSSGVSNRTHRGLLIVDSDSLHTSCGVAQENTQLMMDTERKPLAQENTPMRVDTEHKHVAHVAQENTPIMMDTERKHVAHVAQENTPIMMDIGRSHSGPVCRHHYGRTRQSRLRDASGDSESALHPPSSVRQSVPRWMALAAVIMVVCCFTETVRASVQVQQQLLQQQQQQQHEQQHQVVVASDSIVAEDTSSSPNFMTSDDKPPGGENANCAKQRLQECLALLQTLSTDHNLAFAENEEQLKEMCRTMRSGLRCVNDHVSLCFEPEHRRRIKQLLGGTQKTVQLLCNKGPLREKYLKYAPCMRNVSTDSSLCGGHYQRLISSVDVRDNLSSQDTIRRQCCAFHTYLACVGVAAEGRCGTKAGQFVEEYSYRTAGPIILTRCRGYVPGSSMCSEPSSGSALRLVTSHSSWLLMLLLHLLISIAY